VNELVHGNQVQPGEIIFAGRLVAACIAMQSRAEAIFVLESASIYRGRAQIAQLGLKSRLPTSFAFREYVEVGGLVSYGVNFRAMYGRAADYEARSQSIFRWSCPPSSSWS
jgi:hypothetical protein